METVAAKWVDHSPANAPLLPSVISHTNYCSEEFLGVDPVKGSGAF